MPEWLLALLGEVTRDELLLVGLFFACILAYSAAPQLGEAVGAFFEAPDDDADPRDPR